MNAINQEIQSTAPPALDGGEGVSRILDEKLMELQSLFEISQTLNSSLNLKSILDNILLTPMGKMMITRGMVLLHTEDGQLRVETLKGLPRQLLGQIVFLSPMIAEPFVVGDLIDHSIAGLEFFVHHRLVLLLPIRSSDKTLGLIAFGKKISGKEYLKSEIEYLKSLANIAATSIENGLMVMQLQAVNRQLDKKIQELNTLFDIGKELNSTFDQNKIINLLSYAVMGEMMVNRCLVFVKEDEGMRLAVSKGQKHQEELKQFESSDLLAALGSIEHPIHLKLEARCPAPLSTFQQAGFHAIVPMRIQNQTKGILAIGERINHQDFDQYDLEFLFTLGNEAMICLENARLFKETLEKQRLEEELALARDIQKNLLPRECVKLTNYDIDAINVPSLQVSGDYFDCIRLSEDKICLAIADVSGKGIGAALLMANLQAVLHALIDAEASLTEVAYKINNLIFKNTHYDKFITFFFGILDINENSFTYVNAGHNPPIWLRHDGRIARLEKGGIILGMMPNLSYQQETILLEHGDWIVMYTDGVSEAVNAADEEFEEQRLIEVIRANRAHSASAMKEQILSSVREFTIGQPQRDDITLLCMVHRRSDKPAGEKRNDGK
ncbi:MAG: SpoIIE family protein phosphatase [candidate division KSB1 bacterium]|nr:SpoIIE family protein phosphatase [candidate division KSB1 bacterium]